MSSIFDPDVRAAVKTRVRALRPGSQRRWGRMSAHQAVCHMSDVLRMALRERTVAARPLPFGPLARLVALRLPLAWPRGIRTLPEVEQGCGGTDPVDFERDRADLLALIDRYGCSAPSERAASHPILGTMNPDQWGRWAYRHLDHHLRQFGV